MDREFKSLEFTNIKAQSSGRTRAGIAAVAGNVDSIGDRVVFGAFAKTLTEGAKRSRFLWQHSWQHPPIASIKELREIGRSELPPEVLEKAPDATGGLLVKREYYKGVDLADWVLQAIDAGDVNEMSFGYNVIKSQIITEPIDGDPDKTREVRELLELKLMDCSDVLYGCNAATVADGAKSLGLLPLGVIVSQMAMLEAELKAGRRNAASDQKLLNMIHDTAKTLGAVCNPEEDSEDDEKAKAEAAEKFSTSLSPDWLKIRALELANLDI